MAARVVELQEAVAEFLKSQTLSFTFETLAKHPIEIDLGDTAITRVWVYPEWTTGKQLDIDTRGPFLKRYGLNVHVTNYIDDPNEQSEINDALLLAEELEGVLDGAPQAGFRFIEFGSQAGGDQFAAIQEINEKRYFRVPIVAQYVSSI